MNGADWSKRYPRIVEEAARIKGSAVMDAEVVYPRLERLRTPIDRRWLASNECDVCVCV
jgi:hypothetical protein